MNRDVIVVGASAGGVPVLLDLAAELPSNLPASILVVLHTAREFLSPLPELLSNRGPLPAIHPVHHQELVPGHIYVAPADTQLLVRSGYVEVVRGPRENGHRPAVDALFRTASWAYGSRVIGLVLSGYGDCGTAGMMSIKARGGLAIAQAPESATAQDMPKNVIDRVGVDHVAHPAELPGLLARLAAEPLSTTGPAEVSETIGKLEGGDGTPAELVCPSCQGVLTEARGSNLQHFRCHVGHAFSLQSLASAHSEEVERALWGAVRALEEGAALSRRLSASESNADLRHRFVEKTTTLQAQADLIRGILLHGEPSLIAPPGRS